MRMLWPAANETDPWALYLPDDPGAPQVRLSMVASVDGAATDQEGHSAGLGGEGDWDVFLTLRAQADAVLVGAGTARHEGYGPGRVRRDLAARRRDELGRDQPPAMVLVSRSLWLDPASSIFTEARVPTTVLTCASSDPERRAGLERVARVVVAGDEEVDLAEGLQRVHADIGPLVTCEGGPSLNESLLRAHRVDELCLTLAPKLAGAPGAPRLAAAWDEPAGLSLRHIATDDAGELYLRYGCASSLD